MSEYQYYEFQAVDRRLTQPEMAELRTITSRATITPTLLRNVYHWGDFKGNPAKLVEKYFDGFLYEANWGTRQLMLRLPQRLVDLAAATRCEIDNFSSSLEIRVAGDYVVFDFHRDEEEGGGRWIEEVESEAWLPALLPLRAELAAGDWRCLYLGWLSAIGSGLLADEEDEEEIAEDEEDEERFEDAEEEDDDRVEPPVPPGLKNLSAPQQTLAEFLEISPHLIAVAAERSAPLRQWGSEDRSTSREAAQWIARLSEAEKNALLVRAMKEGSQHLQAELQRRFRQEHEPRKASATRPESPRRTIKELLRAAEARAEAERRAKAEREAQERTRRAREEAIARAKYLDGLVGREEELWRQVEQLIEMKRAAEYDQAIQILKDLRDLAARSNTITAFHARAADLRARHTRKPSFVARMDKAGLA